MQYDHRTFDGAVAKRKTYQAPTLTMGKLTEAQIRLAKSGGEGVRAVVAQLLADGIV